ncbi:MAG: U32 family peptidase [Gammaproteobacteria bacterium]|mgnify:CR=1 FL=1|jgi:U32 family peptidase|nr:U32 family peptidase [Gammaproteobacteria bacterium]MBT4147403.1 U32 family peptidase [Gammaproteobacteria bacterium]MBT5222221.1 U32 family peptidase [Gammaproteobacteria bacterium]MBT5826698.1 U32 family peptidase [Gammaproteobacteria bacterium]MBT5966838.1 U32 family peptidase [Gammaproteobacteria bacterium]
MNKKIELLAPGGDVESIKAAVIAGANAVYCGLVNFNARNRASNLSFDDLDGILRLARQYDCEVFLTLNVVILEQEMASLIKILNKLVNTKIDGIIVQDLGVFNLVKKHFPTLNVHASTQLTTHNEGQIKFLAKLGATRLNLSRELNINEIKSLTSVAHQHDLLSEVFVHGALCVAFSGQCYSSSVSVGNSGNRGSCSQACRDEYEVTETGNIYPLNLKDNSAYFDLPALVDAGVDSLKIEGRIKNAHYVYTVVDTWRKQIDTFEQSGQLQNDDSNLHHVFNRDFTNSFLTGNLTKDMFIDSPRDYSLKHAVKESQVVLLKDIEQVKNNHYQQKNLLGDELAEKIKDLSIAKPSIFLSFSGQLNEPLSLIIIIGDNDKTHTLQTESTLSPAQQSPINQTALEKSFKNFAFNNFDINDFNCTGLGENLSVPFKEVTTLKNQATLLLNNSAKIIPHVDIPELVKHKKLSDKPSLSILIADIKDLFLCDLTDADVYFKLPESLKKGCNKHIDILLNNPRLIPWFPAVLIGKDYDESVRILEQVRPKRIVSNNTGIAYKAFEMDIEWIAGPFLNTTNSYALLTLQEELNCAGAFISNEINRLQIKKIARPKNFKLLYSIYHPILMMTSRQCFFQRTVGCDKPSIEDGCMLKCEKSTTITNTKGVSFAIDKQKGGYPSIYNDEQFLNVDIVNDLSDLFDEFFIDLTDIGSGSKADPDKAQLISQFENILNGDEIAQKNLHQMVALSTSNQYRKGL